MAKKKRPRDPNQLAKSVVDEATDESATLEEAESVAVESGRRGGKVGGPARAAKLTKKQRSEIARKAAQARWNKSSQDQQE